jgi:aspartate-semialdehyde dehydrogenase
MASKILIIDPLTLVGREFIRCLEDAPDLAVEVDYRHTSTDDEHQIAELGARPALVSPFDDPAEIAGLGIVVVTSDTETERTAHLENLLIRHPDVTLVDVSRLPRLAELTVPAVGETVAATDRWHLRVAHPALVAAAKILIALKPLDPVRGSVAAVEPVSVFGREALETLVHQAGRRMQGGEPDHAIGGHVLAFNQVAVDSDALTEEAAELIPDTPLAVTRTLTGSFHGHVAHITIELAEPVDDPELRDAFDAADDIVIGETPISLDVVPDRDHVLLAPPQLSPDRRIVSMTAMIDGLRLGGALTAIEILRAMTIN